MNGLFALCLVEKALEEETECAVPEMMMIVKVKQRNFLNALVKIVQVSVDYKK